MMPPPTSITARAVGGTEFRRHRFHPHHHPSWVRLIQPVLTFVRQRRYGLCLGYEDLKDQEGQRRDLAWQTAAEWDQPLASSPTLCRWENPAGRKAAWRVQEIMLEQFIGSFAQAPAELVLDFDSTDHRVHWKQEGMSGGHLVKRKLPSPSFATETLVCLKALLG